MMKDGNEIWDNLKDKVLAQAGIIIIEAKQCREIALLIAKHTKKNISETTLKRLFGFASSTFEASAYTKNTLAQYCGYLDWENYKQTVIGEATKQIHRQDTWQKISTEAGKVNHFMLAAVKNNTIIPFIEMVHRDFIHAHFLAFDQSGALATVIAAPTGYGKTVALCQWLDQKISRQNENDAVLYLNSSFLLSSLKNVANLNYWMTKMVGLAPSQDFQQLMTEQRSDDRKFYFIIDGFDELMFRKHQFEVLIHLLLDILSIYKNTSWFKIVIAMRDSTWLNWRSQLMIDPKSWFIGQMNKQGQNVDLFTINELHTLMNMKRPFTEQELIADDFGRLRYPLFHSFYYKKYNSIIQYDQFNEVLLFELATDYMSHHIIYGNQAYEKMDFIFYLLQKMEWEGETYKIEKSKINFHQKPLATAYSSLVQIGFLRENETNLAFKKRVYIDFVNFHFLGCCVAAFVLKDDPGFSMIKLEYIRLHWSNDNKLKANILKWFLFQNIATKGLKGWLEAYRLYLNADELYHINEFMLLIENKYV